MPHGIPLKADIKPCSVSGLCTSRVRRVHFERRPAEPAAPARQRRKLRLPWPDVARARAGTRLCSFSPRHAQASRNAIREHAGKCLANLWRLCTRASGQPLRFAKWGQVGCAMRNRPSGIGRGRRCGFLAHPLRIRRSRRCASMASTRSAEQRAGEPCLAGVNHRRMKHCSRVLWEPSIPSTTVVTLNAFSALSTEYLTAQAAMCARARRPCVFP